MMMPAENGAESVERSLTVRKHSEGIPLLQILAWHAARDPDHLAVAIGLPDEDLGQRVHAIVECRPGACVTEHALLDHLKGQIVVTKLPRSVEFVTGPLRGDVGKVRRSALRQERPGLSATVPTNRNGGGPHG
jgi:acyl-CoA synthetase (AMP-forming)/AMP-acid ligase II